MLEWIGLIPLLGLTGNWRGYRMGGKAIGGANMSTDMKKKFEAARAAGNMDQAQAIADKTQKFNDDKKAEKAKAKEAKTIADREAESDSKQARTLSASDIKIKPVAAIKNGQQNERNFAYSSNNLYVVIEPTGKSNSYVVYQNDGVAAKKVATIGLGMEKRLKEEIAKRENKLNNMEEVRRIADKTQAFNDAKKAEKAAKSVLTNDKRGQYDPMKSLSLQERTNLANSFIENSGMSKREAQSFVKKANDFSGGTVREYSKKKQFVDSNNRLYALSSNGKDFVLVGTYNKSGQIE